MYIKIRNLDAPLGEGEKTLSISKISLIQELRKLIESEMGVKREEQILFYKGKQLIDDHNVMDYNIHVNDVVQLMLKVPIPTVEKSEKDETSVKEKIPENIEKSISLIDAESKFYKVGDLIDVLLVDNGAWYEAFIYKILRKDSSERNEATDEDDLIFRVRNSAHVISFEIDAKFDDIRPRSYYSFKPAELEPGMIVLANYNIEEKKNRGPWFEFKVGEVARTTITGAILVGRDRAPLENCTIKFIGEVMRIEKPVLLTDKTDDKLHDACPRKYPFNCLKCRDVPGTKCRECGCRVCAGKESCDTMILCDECDYGYHTTCLNPPLVTVPEDDDWYCPKCKTDDTEIVRAGEKLKKSNKKAKMASSKGESSRDWGKGMACVGRTKECTLVSKDHYGPVPGVEVGTCWKFRLQVSEAGIHRPHVAGIHGRENDGAYSIVLSGGYEDDRDEGEEFFYTGSGGRDLSGNKRCGEQSCDQKLTRMNKALALNCAAPFNDKEGAESDHWQNGKPVRVVRNYKGAKHSKYAPKDGNRYDGLYKVVQYFPERGKSGFIVWKYLLRRDDPVPAPWQEGGQEFEMLYPPGYLEAQEAQEQRKDKENKSKSPDKSKRGSKRKLQESSSNTKPLTDFFSCTPKKSKLQEYKLPKEIADLVQNDAMNEKLWSECEEVLKEGKQKFLAKVEDNFMCICCQEVLMDPITTECKHNICKVIGFTPDNNENNENESVHSSHTMEYVDENCVFFFVPDGIIASDSDVIGFALNTKNNVNNENESFQRDHTMAYIDEKTGFLVPDNIITSDFDVIGLELDRNVNNENLSAQSSHTMAFIDGITKDFVGADSDAKDTAPNTKNAQSSHAIMKYLDEETGFFVADGFVASDSEACLKRSFSAEIYTCPHCRHDLGKDYSMKVNEDLSSALKLLFPGYNSSR